MRYVTTTAAQVWLQVSPIRFGKRDVLQKGRIVECTFTKWGYAYIESPVRGWVALVLLEKIIEPVPEPPDFPGLVAAIRADEQTDCWGTYANITLYPSPKQAKDSPIPLSIGEVARIKNIIGDPKKWPWVATDNTKRIYTIENGKVKITSISAYYSGTLTNYFNVLERSGRWVMVETLRAGSGWHNDPIPPHLLQVVYGLTKDGKLINPPCGDVVLPVITRTGYGWIRDWQLLYC